MFTHKNAAKLVEWIDKKKNPPSARAVAQRYQVYLKQELSEVESSPLESMSGSGSAPKTCANNDKTGQSGLFFLAQQPNPFNPTKRPSIQHYPLQRDDSQ
ncbi:hypothetical protein I307_06276 [Cryptococcus deuterogattii 99/473]|uniref:Unplaced genomic scaffold supercont1.15, whole genome shotgun sequence n=1 Tax=Cryptococcus deuterogattii Ram5 TaxID=1296110 RepID=A0A0D0SYS5_9TREE|nr:hypothetical protein I313_05490 [Cryptococcus deuterogattii Ram5]KIY54391.1 hypothetical protein I307_06276 [Cryptococcus deuterogattii 99/473]